MRFSSKTVSWGVVALLALFGACTTNAVGVSACRSVEEARCQEAPNCPSIDLETPLHNDGDVTACVRFYRDACLHGLTGADPGTTRVQACVAAIRMGDCTTVEHPETNAACAWLVPATDAGAPDADAGDGSIDASDAADAGENG